MPEMIRGGMSPSRAITRNRSTVQHGVNLADNHAFQNGENGSTILEPVRAF